MVPFDLFSWITRIASHAASVDILSEMLLIPAVNVAAFQTVLATSMIAMLLDFKSSLGAHV